jgi:hypothetical protein
MISFRFHLLSLVAAFLSLAVGIVIGTTLADRAIVDGLRNRVNAVSANLDERQAANDRLQAENDRLRSFLDDTGPRLVDGELADQPVVVLVEQGVDDDVVDDTVELLADAGAATRARVEVQPGWSLDDPELRTDLATTLELGPGSAATVRSRIARLLIADLASRVAVTDDDIGAIDTAVTAGLITYDELGEVVLDTEDTMAFVLVTGTNGVVGPDMADMATALAAEGSPTLVADVFDEAAAELAGIERGDQLLELRSVDGVDAAVATVDDLELVQGRLAAILALADATQGVVGHYGYGPGVDGAAPEAAIP